MSGDGKTTEIQVIYVSDPRIDAGRLAEIMKRHNDGESHPSIAASFGISRERVRQIVKKFGGRARQSTRDNVKHGRLSIISDMVASGCSIGEIADELGVSHGYARHLAGEAGLRCTTLAAIERRKKLKRAAGFVLQGSSYTAAASRVGMSAAHVGTYCRAVGIRSQHNSLNPKIASSKAEGRTDA